MEDLKRDNPEQRDLRQSHFFRMLPALARVLLITLGLMSIYVIVKHWIYPDTASLLVQMVTIGFSVLAAIIGAYFAFRSFFDVNEGRQRAAVKTLHESEDRYRSLFDRVPVGLYRTTPDGQILDANPALVEMLGYPNLETLLMVNASDVFVNPEERQREMALLDQAGVVNNIEIQLRRYDGTAIWVEDTVRSILGAEGRVLYYDGSLEDITERKRMEQYVLRTERLAAMGNITAALAHEVKNPLQSILNNLELVLSFSLENDESEECLQVCHREVERLIEITQRMLSFVRPEREAYHPISIPEVWQRTYNLLNKTLQLAAIQVTTNIPENLPQALGIPDQINQVFLNLVLNAIQAMPSGGSLYFEARVEREMLVLTLINNGPPIPDEHIEHIFDPFYTTKPNSSGLGLFISHTIIQHHGGTLSVQNLKGSEGVSFTITLPVVDRAVASITDCEKEQAYDCSM